MLKHDCEFQYLRFDQLGKLCALPGFFVLRGFPQEFSGQNSENHISSNALSEQFIELGTNRSQLFRTLLLNASFCDVLRVNFIFRCGHVGLISKVLILQLGCLKHHNGSSEISLRKVTNGLSEGPWKIKALSLANAI